MPQDEHNEWPSFKTVLRDVATSERPPRPETVAATPQKVVRTAPETTPVEHTATNPATDNDTVDLNLDASEDILVFGSDLLPEPLAPIDIDTSAVRALLLPPTDSPVEDFDLRALDPLEPAVDPFESIDPSPVDPPAPSPFDAPEASTVDLDESAFDTSANFDTTPAFEPESVFDLAFDADALPQVDATPDVFEDLDPMSGISLDDAPQFTGEAEPIDDLASGAVFELDETSIIEADTENEQPSELGDDLFGLAVADEVEDDSTGFDSIATANAIEGELNELSDLTALDSDFALEDESPVEMFDLDNVVPIRPNPSLDDQDVDAPADLANSHWLNPTGSPVAPLSHAADGPPPARVSQTGWVGLEKTQAEPEPVSDDVADPWAHMRPTEEPKSEGFLAKIFGGDERRRAKARRRAKQQAESGSETAGVESDPEISFDSACPNCGGECQVDLDDPIGRRVHVSCPACDHMWFTPYIDAQAG